MLWNLAIGNRQICESVQQHKVWGFSNIGSLTLNISLLALKITGLEPIITPPPPTPPHRCLIRSQKQQMLRPICTSSADRVSPIKHIQQALPFPHPMHENFFFFSFFLGANTYICLGRAMVSLLWIFCDNSEFRKQSGLCLMCSLLES